MVDWGELTLFLYITARMSGFVLFNPLLGRRNIPGIFRGGLILTLSVFVFSVTEQKVDVPGETIVFAIQILLELALGFILGMVMNFFFYIVQLAGLTVDTQMGMTMNQIYDAGAQSNLSVTGEILNVLMTLLFFAANGHHTLLRMMVTSGQIVGFGGVAIGPEVADAALELFGQVGMGILMKAIPQINVFSINIELKVLIGLILLLLLISPFSEFLLQTEMTMLDSLRELLAMTG